MSRFLLVGSLLAIVLAVISFACAARTGRSDVQAKEFRVGVGKLEVTAIPGTISASGFPHASMNPFRREPVHRFRIGQGGTSWVLELPQAQGSRRIESFNMVYRLVDAPEPAILLPDGGFHLLMAGGDGDRVMLRPLGALTGPTPILQWLDGVDGQPGGERSDGIALRTPADIDLSGGRWLLLNRSVVLDVQTLRHYPVAPWIASESTVAMAGLNASTRPAIAFSPDQGHYVMLGEGRADAAEDPFDWALLVVDIHAGTSHGVAIPPALQPGFVAETATRHWIQTHFAWEPGKDGLQLVPRR